MRFSSAHDCRTMLLRGKGPMRTIFYPLAAFTCRHSYFASGLARPLSMRPTADCVRLMQRLHCRLRNETGGGTIHAGVDEAGFLAAALDSATPLGFALVVDDPYFASYTATKWTPGFVVHYSSRSPAAAHPGTRGEQVLAGETVALKTRAFTHRFAAPRQGAAIAVLRASDEAAVFSAPAPAGPFETLALDLRHLAEGRYELRIDGAPALAFYLCDDAPAGLWGVVELFGLGDLVKRGSPPGSAARYAVALEARATIWRYVILGGADATLALAGRVAPAPDAPRKTLAFKGPTTMQFCDRAALVFESASPIALRERPGDLYAMTLTIGRGGAAETTLALPLAGRDTAAGGAGARAGVSEIVVNL